MCKLEKTTHFISMYMDCYKQRKDAEQKEKITYEETKEYFYRSITVI